MEKLPHYNFSWTVSLQKNSSRDKLKIALFGELSLEEAMDLSRDRQILIPSRRIREWMHGSIILDLGTRWR
jgi:hypothetical protein